MTSRRCSMIAHKIRQSREVIAYFTMEIGISHSIPTYSGGLGVLAGDLLKTYADLNIPAVGVTLLNEKGYFTQEIDSEGNQIEKPVEWDPKQRLEVLPNIIEIEIEGRIVKVRAWKLMLKGSLGHDIPVYFLDTNITGNSDYDRTLTSFLYGGDRAYRLCQEMVLGIGGVRILESLGHSVRKYHMNEGHAALLIVELLRKTGKGPEQLEQVKDKCIFTTHTPVEAGHDRFDLALFKRLTGKLVPDFIVKEALHDNMVNMTCLALNHSRYVNGVAKRHGEITKEMFPGYTVDSITNGVHPPSWIVPSMKVVFDKYMPGWITDPMSLRYALSIPNKEIWAAHQKAKEQLIAEVNTRTGQSFHPARFTIGFARRFTEYKRPHLVLYDLTKLKAIAARVGDIQIVFAGKAHSQDTRGKELIRTIINALKQVNAEDTKLKMVFLTHYDLALAKLMVGGCDVWLNTPQRPFEASGTSGMKAALNGVPHLSTLDGWWLEGCIENVTGWSLGPHPKDATFENDCDMSDEAADLHRKLEENIIPMYYQDPDKWSDIMKHSIALNGSFFNTYRMAYQYIANAYLV
jgi:glycogen phosphorylase